MSNSFSRPRLAQVVFDALRKQIEAGSLPDGLILEAAPVARFFELSRTPVTEALQRLVEAGLAHPVRGRGVAIGREAKPLRRDLEAAGLRLPPEARQQLRERNWRARFYPETEQEIAACLPFGRFAINVTQLAAHKGVSRTIAHETLVRLERLGLIRQHGSRWFAGPMSEADIQEHYELRWLLEPLALEQSVKTLPRAMLVAARERVAGALARSDRVTVDVIDRLERDLHVDIVLHAPSRPMAGAIRRSQLPLMATNFSLDKNKDDRVVRDAVTEHLDVLDPLVAGDVATAVAALETHLRSAPTVVRQALRASGATYAPPVYMKREC